MLAQIGKVREHESGLLEDAKEHHSASLGRLQKARDIDRESTPFIRQHFTQRFLLKMRIISLDRSDRSSHHKCNIGGRAEGFVETRTSRMAPTHCEL